MWSSKRNSGMPSECRGRYNAGIYTQLNNICEDCYNLFKEPDVHQLCRQTECFYIYVKIIIFSMDGWIFYVVFSLSRSDCYSSSYFKQCLDALLLAEEQYLNMAQILGR
jgi:hypothetical protein